MELYNILEIVINIVTGITLALLKRNNTIAKNSNWEIKDFKSEYLNAREKDFKCIHETKEMVQTILQKLEDKENESR
jgi:hypothetical protein